MKITKELKYATFSYDELEKTFNISDKEGNTVTLNKVYAFAFMRFVIRMAQRNWLRTKKITPERDVGVLDLPIVPQEAVEELQQLLTFE